MATTTGTGASGSRSKLWILMITAFIDMVGLLMVIPLLPFYAKTLGAGGLIVGTLISSFSVAQLISAPMWGRFSDAYGRRPALLVGLSASVIAYIVFAFALYLPHPLFFLFLSRIVQGAGGGTVSVIQAYVADATAPDERAKALGWLSAATNAGVAIGPAIGPVTLRLGTYGPGVFAAVLCVFNIVFAWRYLHESRDMKEAAESKADTTKRARSRDAIVNVVTHSSTPASRLIWIYAIAIGAFQGVTSMLALLLSARFGVTANTIGYFFTYIGVLSVVTRAFILSRMIDRFGEARLVRIGQFLLAIGLALLSIIRPLADPAAVAAMLGGILPTRAVALLPYLPLAIAVALLPLGTAFTFPCVTSLLSRVISSKERGLYMGVQQTFGGLARVVFPILFGFLYDRGAGLPFLMSATLVLFTVYLGVGMDSYARTDAKAAAA
jgi:MFS family permease